MRPLKNTTIILSCGLLLSALNALAQSAPSGIRVQQVPLSLALDNLRRSQERFAAGVTVSAEVMQSEESLAAAESDYIDSFLLPEPSQNQHVARSRRS